MIYMKIGIVTLPLHKNFGGYLQNYALQTLLRDLGHEPLTLNQRLRRKPLREVIYRIYLPNLKTLVMMILGKRNGRPFRHNHCRKLNYIICESPHYFMNKYIEHTQPLNPKKELKGICEKYNLKALIVGSDQVWRAKYVENIFTYFLSFAKNDSVKKLSYAASFGIDKWVFSEKETAILKHLIADFSLVTVREESAMVLCKKMLEVDSYQVLDPTMLLEKEDYIRIVEAEKEPVSDGNLFCYILDRSPEKTRFVNIVEEKYNLSAFYVNMGESPLFYSRKYILGNINKFKTPSITKWIRGFMDAEFVIADSFHAVAFSIIFNKPFWVVGNPERGLARFESILKMFNLENRLINISEIDNFKGFDQPINWDSVNKIRNEWKERSISLLRNNL